MSKVYRYFHELLSPGGNEKEHGVYCLVEAIMLLVEGWAFGQGGGDFHLIYLDEDMC